MRLSEKIGLVVGGTGSIGEGVVKALLASGASVIVLSRSEGRINTLRSYVTSQYDAKLQSVIGDISHDSEAKRIGSLIKKQYGELDYLVDCMGGKVQGYPVYSLPFNQWDRVVNTNLTCHFLTIKTFIPLLNHQNSYLFHVNSFLAEKTLPSNGPQAISAAAQKAMILTLAEELRNTGIHVYELITGTIKTRNWDQARKADPDWLFPEEIGAYMVEEMTKSQPEKLIHYLLSRSHSMHSSLRSMGT